MMNEMMRSHDRIIGNLHGLPGGEAALQQLYTDVQEPLYDSCASVDLCNLSNKCICSGQWQPVRVTTHQQHTNDKHCRSREYCTRARSLGIRSTTTAGRTEHRRQYR